MPIEEVSCSETYSVLSFSQQTHTTCIPLDFNVVKDIAVPVTFIEIHMPLEIPSTVHPTILCNKYEHLLFDDNC
jgi:hypothetical protein